MVLNFFIMKKSIFIYVMVLTICITSCNGSGKSSNMTDNAAVTEDSLQDSSNNIDSDEVVLLNIVLKNMDGLAEYASFGKDITIKFLGESDAEDGFVNLVATLTLNVKSAVCSDENFMYHYSVVDKNSTEIAKLGFHPLNFDINPDEREFRNFIKEGEYPFELQIDRMVTKEQWERVIKDGVSVVVEPEDSYNNYKEIPKYKPYTVSEE